MSKLVGMAGELQYNAAADFVREVKPETIIGEFIRNGIEAPCATGKNNKTIVWGVTEIEGVDKLHVINDGKGMSFEQLQALENLAVKGEKGQSIQRNFGMGARLSGLSASPYGLVYESSINGCIHKVTFSIETEGDAEHIVMSDIETVQSDLDAEWVKVTFLGDSKSTDTVKHPWKNSLTYPIPDGIRNRFFRFSPDVTIRARLQVFGEVSRIENRLTLPMEDTLKSKNFINYEAVTENGITYHYALLASAKTHHGKTIKTGGGIVYRNEIYDFAQNKNWAETATRCSLVDVGDLVSCFVELPDDYNVKNDFSRSALLLGSDVLRIEELAAGIKANKPQWLAALIKSESDKRRNDRNKASQDQLTDLIKGLTQSLTGLGRGQGDDTGKPGVGVSGMGRKGGKGKEGNTEGGVIPVKPLDDDGIEKAKKVTMWMPLPDIAVVHEGDPDYQYVTDVAVNALFYNPKDRTRIYIDGENPIITGQVKLATIAIMKHKKGLDYDDVMDAIRIDIESSAETIVGTGFIGAMASAKHYGWKKQAISGAVEGQVLSSHLTHLVAMTNSIVTIHKRKYA